MSDFSVQFENETSPSSSPNSITKKFFTGFFGGVVSSVCSHPFDVIKSRVQTGMFPNVKTTVRETYRREGITAFYKGVSAPISVAGLFSAVLFASNEVALNSLIYCFPISDLQQIRPHESFSSSTIPISYLAIAGAMSSPTAALVLTPADRIKIALQLQKGNAENNAKPKYNGMIDCFVKISREEGLHSLMRGYVPTVGSRLVGFPAFFIGHEYGKRWWKKKFPNSPDLITELFSGSCSGILLQIVYSPFELVKTRVQGMDRKTPRQVVKEIYKSYGVKGFYFSFWVSLLRAVPANATVFAGVDVGCKIWDG